MNLAIYVGMDLATIDFVKKEDIYEYY